MPEALQQKDVKRSTDNLENIFVVLCASGFESPARMRSALMFASLAAAANYRAVLYCIQSAVDVLVRGAVEKREKGEPGTPTIRERLNEAIEMGVEIQCCTQSMANRNLTQAELIPGVTPAGAMSLIDLASLARGSLCF